MYLRMALGVLAGGGLGALMGYFGQCSTGACPLTATWWRGAMFGAAIGAMMVGSMASPTPP